MLRLTFLGTAAAQPTLRRNLTGLSVRREGEMWLVDCGEGTQRQMIHYGAGFDVAAIFFTHFHADHYLGAIGFADGAGASAPVMTTPTCSARSSVATPDAPAA